MSTYDDLDIFNVSVSDIQSQDAKTSTKDEDLYKPSADDGKDNTYSSLIRFMPNIHNPKKPFLKKYFYWLDNVDGSSQKGFYIDSPSSIGEADPIQQMFFKLRNSESAKDKENSSKLKRKEKYYALIQIIKDTNNPEFEGKFKIFEFGYKIKSKIDAALKPEFGNPVNVSDPFTGKPFVLKITKVAGYNNYDSCEFLGEPQPISINGKSLTQTAEDKKMFVDLLKAAPSLDKYEFKPWTDEQINKVNNVLAYYSGNTVQNAMSVINSSNVKGSGNIEDVESDDFLANVLGTTETSSPTKAKKAEVSKESNTSTDNSDESLDDFLDNL